MARGYRTTDGTGGKRRVVGARAKKRENDETPIIPRDKWPEGGVRRLSGRTRETAFIRSNPRRKRTSCSTRTGTSVFRNIRIGESTRTRSPREVNLSMTPDQRWKLNSTGDRATTLPFRGISDTLLALQCTHICTRVCNLLNNCYVNPSTIEQK